MKAVIHPTFKNIAVSPLKDASAKESEAAGIIVPGSDGNGPSRKGTIIAVGPSVDRELLNTGDVVVYKNYGYESIKVGEDTILVMADENVVAKFTEEAA